MNPNEPVLTVEELATRWRVSGRTVRDMLLAGEVDGFQIRRAWRITLSAVLDYEAGKRKDPGMPKPVVTRIT